MLFVYIGPNGYGKTTRLREKKSELVSNGVSEKDILFMESEILLLDEVKDSKDDAKTMEYILTELLVADDVYNARLEFENQIDLIINSNIDAMNAIIDDVIQINEQRRSGNFLSTSQNKEYKKLVKINSNDVKNKMGSG